MSNIAVIPARSGSKGLKDKNIKNLAGKPLMVYSIEAALKSGIFDEIMVSTDSEKYASIAREYGASVPFMRSAETSTDKASSWDTVREVLRNYEAYGKVFDSVTLLQPTSPLRNAFDIREAYQIFESKKAKAVVGVCEMEHSPLWSNILPDDDSLKGFLRPEVLSGRQSLENYYRINGAVYIYRLDDYKKLQFSLYDENSFAYRMPVRRSIDIDTEVDFVIAECLMKISRELCE